MSHPDVDNARMELEKARVNLEKQVTLVGSRIKYHRDMKVEKSCPLPLCSTVSTVWVNADDYTRWRRRDKVMDAMPYLTDEEREVVLHGICNECFERTKPTDD